MSLEGWWGGEGVLGRDRVTNIQQLTMTPIHCFSLAAALKDKKNQPVVIEDFSYSHGSWKQ